MPTSIKLLCQDDSRVDSAEDYDEKWSENYLQERLAQALGAHSTYSFECSDRLSCFHPGRGGSEHGRQL